MACALGCGSRDLKNERRFLIRKPGELFSTPTDLKVCGKCFEKSLCDLCGKGISSDDPGKIPGDFADGAAIIYDGALIHPGKCDLLMMHFLHRLNKGLSFSLDTLCETRRPPPGECCAFCFFFCDGIGPHGRIKRECLAIADSEETVFFHLECFPMARYTARGYSNASKLAVYSK